MNRPAVFFDRDNTLIVTNDYLGDPEQVVLADGAADAVARARALGFRTVVVSNQSGVARGKYTEDDVRAVNDRMTGMLRRQNADAVIDRHEYCPHHPEASIERYRKTCDCRKPGVGMIRNAAEALEIDLARSWVIGDAPRDVESGKKAGCRAILLRDPKLAPSPAAGARSAVEPDYVASSLADALDFVEMHASDVSSNESDMQIRVRQLEAEPAGTAGNGHTSGEDARHQRLLLQKILEQLKTNREQPHDFSVPRLLAGMVQGFALAAVFGAYLYRNDAGTHQSLMMLAIFLQALTATLYLMTR